MKKAESNIKPNRLIHEKSPYLLQHAYNPVHWYPWDDEAFDLARRDNKPIFLSIGYSTCHWCHVMERESFENNAIADYLNNHFISIKVDREERPDIDQVYMTATQAITGGGGWPMSVFLFPDKKPFYAGTYFPPEPRYNHPGFPELLRSIMRAWKENMTGLEESANKITGYLSTISGGESSGKLRQSWLEEGFTSLLQSYDSQHHGFGTGNKFPRPAVLDFLHQYWHHSGNKRSHQMVEYTLTAMAKGGLYDHIGGGFHRYTVDRQWRIPHFEKMLYDQAQLISTYLHMHQQTGDEFYGEIAEQTIEYVLRDLQHPEGGLYSAEDADSVNPYDEREHGEGAFYLWKATELRKILSEEEAELFLPCYGIEETGNAPEDPANEFSGRNILYLAQPAEDITDNTHDEAWVKKMLQQARMKLLKTRNTRTRPHLDDKIITAWNGLMISALAKAASILGESRYLEEAARIAAFIEARLYREGLLFRRWREGEARFDGVLDDYAFVIQGLIDLHQAGQNPQHLELALSLSAKQLELFSDENGGFFNSRQSNTVLTRMKESYDGAEPSGNSVSALNFIRLGRLLNRPEWIAIGEKTIRAFSTMLSQHPTAMPLMLAALQLLSAPAKQLVISGKREAADTLELLHQARCVYSPDLLVLLADGDTNQQLLKDSIAVLGDVNNPATGAKAYLCQNFSCALPTSDPSQLRRILN